MRFNRKVTFIVGLVASNDTPLNRDVVLQDVAEVLAVQSINGFTATDNTGYWNGQQEPSLTITVFCNNLAPVAINAEQTAQALAVACCQECVLWSIESAVYAGLAYAS